MKTINKLILAIAGLIIFFLGLVQKNTAPAICLFDVFLGALMTTPFLYEVNHYDR